MPKISMIAAMAHNRVIGADNGMPWHLPADLKHFKQITMGKPVVMGRKTYESIGKALPKRDNIVISRSGFHCTDALVVKSVEQGIQAATDSLTENDGEPLRDEIMIIGGGAIYENCLPMATRLYLTLIDLNVEGDTVFPDYQRFAKWQELAFERHQPDEKNPYHYDFLTLERLP